MDSAHFRHYKAQAVRTAHYYVYGNLDKQCDRTWLTLHGYGQKADHLVRKFDVLAPAKHYVVSPEGLSRFYWKGVTGEVVASWMTKEDRLDEIADYTRWLDRVHDISGLKRSSIPLTVFGYSQGCATAWRWLINSKPRVDTFIMWSGWLPEDMDYHRHHAYLSTIRLIYVHGESDPYYANDRFSLLKRRFDEAGLKPEIVTHPGGHALERDLLARVAEML